MNRRHVRISGYGKPIEWNTEPVINNVPFVDRDGYFNCQDWMTWHGKVEAKWGTARANEVFMVWWNKQNMISYAQDCYISNRTFRDWWDKKGLPSETMGKYITAPYDAVTDIQKKILSTATNVVDNTGDAANALAKGAKNTAKTAGFVAPALLIVALIGVGVYVHKNYIKGNKKVSK